MSIIHYTFADGHTEEIEVTEEVAAAFEQLEKYEKKVGRRENRRHISISDGDKADKTGKKKPPYRWFSWSC